MKSKQAIAAAVLCAASAGCASTRHDADVGTLTQERAAAMLVTGRTTRDDVRQVFGAAIVTAFPSGREVWFYQSGNGAHRLARYVPLVGQLSSGAATVRELKVLFDRDGRVPRFKLQDAML